MQILPNIPFNIGLLSGKRRKWIRSKCTVEVNIWRGESISGSRRDMRLCMSQNLLSETTKEA